MRNSSSEKNGLTHDDLTVQLPVPIDSRKYLIGRIAFVDVFITLPFIVITALLLVFFKSLGLLNQFVFIFSCIPAAGVIAGQMLKHPVRKEISYMQYAVLWKYRFKKRQKVFFKRKGTMDMSDTQDARRVIGVKKPYADCYETSKNLVRVFEISSVNLSLSNSSEKKASLEAFRTFLTSSDFYKQIQFCKIAQPINLEKHLLHFHTKRNQSIDKLSNPSDISLKGMEMLAKSYESEIHNISKDRNLVTRKNYIVITQPIKNDRDKALELIDGTSKILISKLEGLIIDRSSLKVHQLNNEELTLLLHTCIDFDSSVSVGNHILKRTESYSEYSMGEDSAKKLIASLTKQLQQSIR
ncbi:hypothetical protein QK289_14305 [Exiguobacterium antarcticum]|uniref:Uncharacterized protein n=1 Tax=Exiguobacterium antarcticum TaxID=132920 RepID=A0ABT6R5E5_9BACL|nr:hypothetical protein [Exiguobacterium antarcticum]MDI3236183.1 hypothetical protein [Exiguobacterium antarcticum]